jgi:hypothetical protein
MMGFDFEIHCKTGSEMPGDVLSRSFIEIRAVSALDINWAPKQEKNNLSIYLRKSEQAVDIQIFYTKLVQESKTHCTHGSHQKQCDLD